MFTITRKDLLLTINDNVIPAMGSSDVPVKFINDEETYQGFMIEPRVGYYVNGCPKSTVCEYDTSSNIIKIPAEAFKNKGILVIAIALIDNADSNHIEVTKELALEVTPAPNGTVIFPATDTWQTAVNNLVEQLYNQDYKPLYDQALSNINEAVETANTASDNANLASQNVQTAYENLGDYKVENGVIYFKKADGTYNEQGITLAGQSSVLDGNGNVILSGNITPNDNLLTNSDFKSWIINSGGYPTYGGSTGHAKAYTIDMWYIQSANVSTAQVLVNSNSITIKNTNTSNDVIFGQSLERIFPSGDYCYFVRVKSVTGTVNAFMTNYEKLTKLVVGDNFVKETGQVGAFGLQLKLNSTIEIEYIKVEKGKYFTGMPMYNRAIELLKCQYNGVLVKSYNPFSARADGTYMSFLIPCMEMRKTPSIKNNKLFIIGNGESASYTGEITCINTPNGIRCVFNYQKVGSYVVCFEQDTFIDSNDY